MSVNTSTDTAEYPVPAKGPDAAEPDASSPSVRVDIAGRSHTGKVRPNNEDNFLVVRFGRFLQAMLSSLPEGDLSPEYALEGYGIAVADGMGGMAAGEVASRRSISLLINLVLETPDWMLSQQEPYVDTVVERAVERFYKVNQSIIEQGRQEPRLRGMGTTLTMACSLGMDLLIVHVGDSPAYLSRGGKLHRLTRDHTVAQAMADHGTIAVTDIPPRYHHMLTHAIGIRDAGTVPDICRMHLCDGDRLLLCTDGLTDMADNATIGAVLQGQRSSQEACQALIDLALERGGKDNVTVVVADYHND
jgi:PPM family protein phosphatase